MHFHFYSSHFWSDKFFPSTYCVVKLKRFSSLPRVKGKLFLFNMKIVPIPLTLMASEKNIVKLLKLLFSLSVFGFYKRKKKRFPHDNSKKHNKISSKKMIYFWKMKRKTLHVASAKKKSCWLEKKFVEKCFNFFFLYLRLWVFVRIVFLHMQAVLLVQSIETSAERQTKKQTEHLEVEK